jgi:hypothetical protein
MTVTSILPRKNADPARLALAAAITKAEKAAAEYKRHREAVGRSRELVRRNKTRLEQMAAAIEAAKETDVLELVESIAAGGSSSGRALREARLAQVEAADDLEMAEIAAKTLWSDNTAEREAERAGEAVNAAIAVVIEPIARELLAESRNLRERDWAILERLTVIRDALGHKHPLYAEIERLWVQSPASEEVLQRSMMIQRSWKAAIEALKSNADSALPAEV